MYSTVQKTSQHWNVQILNTQNDVNNIASQSESRFVRRQSSQTNLSPQNNGYTLSSKIGCFSLAVLSLVSIAAAVTVNPLISR